ncbi:MAG: 4-hydroxythreonine-4-phosphate dehydrogenase PdxA, partial [Planctomycetota bacterium]
MAPATTRLPKIGITVGDVAGVGPEIALRCMGLDDVRQICTPLLFGPVDAIKHLADRYRLPCPPLIGSAGKNEWLTNEELPETGGLVDIGTVSISDLRPGHFSGQTGQASFDAVQAAIDAAIAGQVDGIVTCPIQKEAWHLAGIAFPGHTELLASRTGTDNVKMMLTSDEISCVLVTIHIPLANVPAALTREAVLDAIRLAAASLGRRLGRSARVVVCGLNPHAGENGIFSHGEEETLIAPAIRQASDEGIDVVGPLSPDTAFTPSMRASTDVYVCMYHDQGLIPLKALSFDDAVNVTLGLP